MPHSLSLVVVHIIFATKGRAPLINDTIRPRLHTYLAGTAKSLNAECYRAGGVADHVHLAIRLPRTITAAKLIEEIKTACSKWMKTEGVPTFAWQSGYAIFSVGPSDLNALLEYIDTQEAHHKKQSFQDELRAFLKKYGIEYDEQYLWD